MEAPTITISFICTEEQVEESRGHSSKDDFVREDFPLLHEHDHVAQLAVAAEGVQSVQKVVLKSNDSLRIENVDSNYILTSY